MTVLVENRDGSLVITINRPEAGNSLNLAVAEGIAGALTDAVTNPDVSTVIVTGAGEKIFCAGMDLKAFAAGENMMPVADALRLLNEFPKPV
ncbi:MAG: enoyl-CoA hydratase/isomerase family protein, partial [Ilumatobacteraceae bacterium]